LSPVNYGLTTCDKLSLLSESYVTLRGSVVNPRHFGADPDPRIRKTDFQDLAPDPAVFDSVLNMHK
jgi:hypothetical protein